MAVKSTLRKVLTTLGVALMASTALISPAHAEPITTALFGAAFAASTGGALVSALFGTAASWAAAQVINWIFPEDKKKSNENPTQWGEQVPHNGIFGTQEVPVHVLHMNEYNDAKVFQLVLGLASAKIEGIYKCRVNGKLHAVTETATSGNNEHKRYTVNGFDGKLVLRLHDGREGQAADTNLVAQCTGWTSDKKFSGCAYVVAEITSDKELFNGIPDVEPIPRGQLCYDPRLDDTRPGGSGDHRFATQSTWEPSNNPAVQAFHYLLGFYHDGFKMLGPGFSNAKLEFDTFIAAMNTSDETVSIPGGGTRARYESHFAFTDADSYGDILDVLCEAMGGFWCERSGKIAIFAGAAQTSVMTVTDEDIVTEDGEEIFFSQKIPGETLYTGIQGTYTRGSDLIPQGYKTIAPSLFVPTGQEPHLLDASFPQIKDPHQAYSVAKQRLFAMHEQATASIVLDIKDLVLEIADWMRWNSSRPDRGDRYYKVMGTAYNLAKTRIKLSLREISAEVFDDDATAEDILEPGREIPEATYIQEVTNLTVTVIALPGSDGTELPALFIEYDGIDDPAIPQVKFEYYAEADVGEGIPQGPTLKATDITPADGEFTISAGISGVLSYQVRARPIAKAGRLTNWSEWEQSDVPTGGIIAKVGPGTITDVELADNSVTEQKIHDAAVSANKIMTDAVTSIKIAAGAVETAEIAVAAVVAASIDVGAVIASKIGALAVTTAKIAADAVTSVELANNAVDTAAMQVAAVTSTIIANNAVQTANIDALAVTAAKVANATLTAAQIANDTITAGQIAANAVTTSELNALAVTTAKIAALAVTSAEIANDTITAGQIAASAVSTSELNALAVTTAKIAALAVTTAELGNDAVTSAKILANTIVAGDVAAATITTTEIAAGTITASNILSSTITTTQIAANTILAADIAAGTITTTEIAANTITASDIAAATITSVEIAAGTITASNILSSTITTTQIAANTILAADISAGAITTTEIAANTIVAADIASGTITTTEIAANTIVAADIASGTITTTEIAANTIVAADIASGTITTTQIAAGTIVASNIQSGTITGTQIAAATIAGSNIVADTITASNLHLANFTNLVPDPDMVDSAAWSFGATWSIVSNPIGGGSSPSNINSPRVMQSTDNATGLTANAFRGQVTPAKTWIATAGETYAISYRIRTVSGGTAKGNVTLYYQWYDSTGTIISETALGSGTIDESTNSTLHTGLTTAAPTTTKYMMFRLRRGANSAGQSVGQFWVFDLDVRRAADATLIVDGTITAAKIVAATITATELASDSVTSAKILAGTIVAADIQSGTITGTQIAANTIAASNIVAGTITASRMVLTDYTNLVGDPAFLDTSAWTLGSTWSIVASPIGGGTGSTNINSAYVLQSTENVTGLGAGAFRGDAVPAQNWLVKQGEDYNVSWYGRTVSGGIAKGTATVYARFFDRDNVFISETAAGTVITDESTTATTIRTGIVTAPAGAGYMGLRVRRGANAAGQSQNQFWIWGLNVRRAADASLIVDGAITATKILADSITVNRLEIAARGLTSEDITFEHNASAIGTASTNKAAWSAGTVSYVNDAGTSTTAAISAGATGTWSSGTIYIYWVKGATSFSTTTTLSTAKAAGNAVVATYKGLKKLNVMLGSKIVLDGDDLKALSVDTPFIANNAISVVGSDFASSYVDITTTAPSGTGPWVDIATVTFTPLDGVVTLIGGGTIYTRNSGYSGQVEVALRKGSTVLVSREPLYYNDGLYEKSPFTLVYKDSAPGTSAVSYKLSARVKGGDGGTVGAYATTTTASGLVAVNYKK